MTKVPLGGTEKELIPLIVAKKAQKRIC
jgi:hypothetical protein